MSPYRSVLENRPDLIVQETPLPNGGVRREGRDFLHRVRIQEEPDGSWLRYRYDFSGKLLGVFHSSGDQVEFSGDRQSGQWGALTGRTETLVRVDRNGFPVEVIQRTDGFEWRMKYRLESGGRLELSEGPWAEQVKKHLQVETDRRQKQTTLCFSTGATTVERMSRGEKLRLDQVRLLPAVGESRSVDLQYGPDGRLRCLGSVEAEYDPKGHLVGWGERWRCDFDGQGRQARKVVDGNRFEYAHNDRVVAEARCAEHTLSFVYDQLGRRAVRRGPEGETRYHYNLFGRLGRVELPGGRRIDYLYDGFGRLVGREIDGEPRYYIVGIDGNRLAEADREGRILSVYLWIGPQCVARVQGERLTETYHRAVGGRLVGIGDAQGVIREPCTDDPYGGPVAEGVPGLGSLFGDPLTGLVHAGTRWLDPQLGQFLSPDSWYGVDPEELVPQEFRTAFRTTPGGTARCISDETAYLWCAGDPVNFTDPTGHNWLGVVWSVLSAFLWGAQTNSMALQMELVNILADPIRFFVGLFGPGLDWYWKHSVFNFTGPVGSYRMMTGALLLNGLWREVNSQDTLWVMGNVIWARPGDWEALAEERMRDLVVASAAPRFLAATAPAAADVLRIRNPRAKAGGTVAARAAGAGADSIENVIWVPADSTAIADGFADRDYLVIQRAGASEDEIRRVDTVSGNVISLHGPLLPAEYAGQAVEVTRLDPSFVRLEHGGQFLGQTITFVRGETIHLPRQVPDYLPGIDLIVKEMIPARAPHRLDFVDFPIELIVLRMKQGETNAGFPGSQFIRIQRGESWFARRVVRPRVSREIVIEPPLDPARGPYAGLEVLEMQPSGGSQMDLAALDDPAGGRTRLALGELRARIDAAGRSLRRLDGLELSSAGGKERRIILGFRLLLAVDPLPASLQGGEIRVERLAGEASARSVGKMVGAAGNLVGLPADGTGGVEAGRSLRVRTTGESPVTAFAMVASRSPEGQLTLEAPLPLPAFAADVAVEVLPLTLVRTHQAEPVTAPGEQVVIHSDDASEIEAGAIIRVCAAAPPNPCVFREISSAPQEVALLNEPLPDSHATGLAVAHFVANPDLRRTQVSVPEVRHVLTTRDPAPYAAGGFLHIEGYSSEETCAEILRVDDRQVFLKEPVDGITKYTVTLTGVEFTGTESRGGKLEGGTVLVPADPNVELSRMDALQQHELRHVWQAAIWGPFWLSLPIPWLFHFGFSFSPLSNSASSWVRHFSFGILDTIFAGIAWGIGSRESPTRLDGEVGADRKVITLLGTPAAEQVGKFAAGRRVTVINGDLEALNYVDGLDAGAGRVTLRFALDADIFDIAEPGDTVQLCMSPFENIRQTVNTWFSLNLEQLWAEHIPVAWGRALSNFLNRDSWFPGLGVYPLAWLIAKGDRDRVPAEQEAAYLTGEVYTTIPLARPKEIFVGQFARLFAFLKARSGGISVQDGTVNSLAVELPPGPATPPVPSAEEMAARVDGAVLVPGARQVRFREHRFIPMKERVENVFGAFFSTSLPGTYQLKAPGMLRESVVFKFGFDVDFVELNQIEVKPLVVSPSPAEAFYETERVDFGIRGDETARYELRFLPGSADNLGVVAGRRYTVGTLPAGAGTRPQKLQIITRYRSEDPVFRGPGQMDQTFLRPADLTNLCEEHTLTIHELTAPALGTVHAGTVKEFTVPIAPHQVRVTTARPAGALVNARIINGSSRPARLQFVAPNNVDATTTVTFELVFGADPAHRKTIPVTVPVEPAPAPLPTDPPFLSAVAGDDYLRYIQAPTLGLARPLINGRSSGGAGPDVDLTEPLDRMEATVKSLGAGDFVYLSAWFFEPATELTAGGYLGAVTWGDLFAKKADEGVKVRILINDFDPISGMDRWLQADDLNPLNAIIAALPAAKRDNYKYVVSLHPAHVGSFKSLLAGQGGRDIFVASHHQKFMVAKRGDEMFAFCGGLDIESRKTPALWSYGGLIGWHDLHVMLEGPVTRDLEKEFVLRWNREKDHSTRRPLSGWAGYETLARTPLSAVDNAAAKKPHRLQMLRTVSTESAWGPYSNERDDISEVHRRAIETAEHYLYLENQYFRNARLADWVVRQGRARPNLVVIMVVVASAAADDGTNAITEHGDALQFQTFDTILSGLGARARLYTMTNRAVHSKFMMVDDRWMTIGSANANVRSFELDSELNLSIGDPALVVEFRRRLWAHNLGLTEAAVAGWTVAEFITRWDAVATANSGRAPIDMDGEGVVRFDYTTVPGVHHGSIPDALARLDLGPPGHLFAGPVPEGEETIRLA